MSERSKEAVLKTVEPTRLRGFESLSLRKKPPCQRVAFLLQKYLPHILCASFLPKTKSLYPTKLMTRVRMVTITLAIPTAIPTRGR